MDCAAGLFFSPWTQIIFKVRKNGKCSQFESVFPSLEIPSFKDLCVPQMEVQFEGWGTILQSAVVWQVPLAALRRNCWFCFFSCHLCMSAELKKTFLASTKRDPAFISKGFTCWKDGASAFNMHLTVVAIAKQWQQCKSRLETLGNCWALSTSERRLKTEPCFVESNRICAFSHTSAMP